MSSDNGKSLHETRYGMRRDARSTVAVMGILTENSTPSMIKRKQRSRNGRLDSVFTNTAYGDKTVDDGRKDTLPGL